MNHAITTMNSQPAIKKKPMKTAAIVLAAGRGSRMHAKVQKQYLPICNKPVIYYTLRAFEASDVDGVVLVTGADEIDYCRKEIVTAYGFQKVCAVVPGGGERYESVWNGLLALTDSGCEYVLIHDGARPMITPELINENIICVRESGACVTAVPSKDTVKIADADGFIKTTPERSSVWMMQTPQSFRYEMVLEAYQKRDEADDRTVTDDAMVVEKYANHKIRLLKGDYRNLKITTPEDMILAQVLVGEKENMICNN